MTAEERVKEEVHIGKRGSSLCLFALSVRVLGSWCARSLSRVLARGSDVQGGHHSGDVPVEGWTGVLDGLQRS